MKKPDVLTIAIERGADGYSAAWCVELPGCYTLVPPGADPLYRAGLAALEFASWAHNRAAERLTIDKDHLTVSQVLDTGEDVRSGDGSAFFLHDAEPANAREFPTWANAHDLALDELQALAQSLPGGLLEHGLDGTESRTIFSVLTHAAATERWFAAQLLGHDGRKADRPDTVRELQDAHRFLQEAVCDVPTTLRVRRETSPLHGTEEWSVRKVMRRSIQHLRYHTWEVRRTLSRLWLD